MNKTKQNTNAANKRSALFVKLLFFLSTVTFIGEAKALSTRMTVLLTSEGVVSREGETEKTRAFFHGFEKRKKIRRERESDTEHIGLGGGRTRNKKQELC